MPTGIKGASRSYQPPSANSEQEHTALHALQEKKAGNKSLRLENGKLTAGHKGAKTTAFLRTVKKVLDQVGGSKKYSPLAKINQIITGKLSSLEALDHEQHEAACRLIDKLSGQVSIPETSLKNRSITVNDAAKQLVKANNRAVASWQIPNPVEASSTASLSPIAINNLEYRVEPDATKVERKLNDEMLAARTQQKDEFKHVEELEDLLKEKAAAKNKGVEERRFQFVNPFDHKKFAPTRFASVMEERAPQHILTLETADITAAPVPAHKEAAVATSWGRNDYMEDRHLATTFTFKAGEQEYSVKLTGIFDGHGGNEAAEHATNNIQQHLTNRLQEFNPKELTDAGIWNALKLAMVDLSNSYNTDLGKAFNAKAGTTANVCLMLDGNLWTANVGDSRALLIAPEGDCLQLSRDAKPSDEAFKHSIEQRGGHVSKDRVDFPDGRPGIATARSIGEQRFDGVISARPKITKLSCPSNGWDGYQLVQGCDGIFDVSTTDDIADFVHACKGEKFSAEQTATELVETVYRAGSKDNLSAMVIPLE